MSIFTGVEPPAHGCIYYKNTGRLNQNYDTMAKIFSRHGFRTAAFTGGGYMGAPYGTFVGFEKFKGRTKSTGKGGGRRLIHSMPDVWQWLEEVGDHPMFLFVHGFEAHAPYSPPEPYRSRFSAGYSGGYKISSFGKGKPRPNAVDLEYVISQYDGEIAYADDTVGDFLDELDERGILKETLLIIMTDHGDEFFEHGSCDHIHSLFDELVRAAWIMFGPSVPSMKIRDHVGTIDILPTVLDIFGIEADARFQGVSRWNSLDAHEEARDDYIFCFTGAARKPEHLSGVRTNRWKLVTDRIAGRKNRRCPQCRAGGHQETLVMLFDLQKDPEERHNVADAYPEVVRDLLARLERRIAESQALKLTTEELPRLTKEHIEALRSLGYVD